MTVDTGVPCQFPRHFCYKKGHFSSSKQTKKSLENRKKLDVYMYVCVLACANVKACVVCAAGSFSFLRPLQTEIWMCIVFSYLSVSVVLFIVSRISLVAWMPPSEIEEAEHAVGVAGGGGEYQFTLSNCFFLMLGAVLQRGEDICDKLVSPLSSNKSKYTITSAHGQHFSSWDEKIDVGFDQIHR